MPHRRRTASVLLLCLVIISTLLMIAFAYVRVAQLGQETNDQTARALLAREAAVMGLNHAIEQILRDHVDGPVTRLDDASHAAFTAHYHPNESDYRTDTLPPSLTNVNDLPGEAPIDDVEWLPYAAGMHIWDGRGRFYEPEFHNLATKGFDAAATVPTAPVKFGDNPWPAASAIPDRNAGIWYDAEMHRISTGDARADRAKARFRLRYAIGTQDLDGAVLINGDPAVDHKLITSADPAAAPTPEVARVVRAMHQLPHLVFPLLRFGKHDNTYAWNAGPYGKDRVEHVFIGRGATSNVDIDPVSKAPVTFPLMYRNTHSGDFKAASSLYLAPAVATGGTAITLADDTRLTRALLGPQYSFAQYDEAIEGRSVDADKAYARNWATPFGRGLAVGTRGRWSGPVGTPWCVNAMTAPIAVVNGLVAGFMPPGALCRYMQDSPPATPAILVTDWIGGSLTISITGTRDLFVDKLSPAFSGFAAPARAAPAVSPDYHATDTRAWHARYPGRLAYNGEQPTAGLPRLNDNLGVYLRSTLRTTAVTANGGQIDRTGRPDVERKFWRFKERDNPVPMHAQSRNEAQFWIRRDLGDGAYGNQPADPWDPLVTYAPNNRCKKGTLTYRSTTTNINRSPDLSPADWARDWMADGSQVGVISAHPDSIWDAVGTAFGAALSVARGTYLQYTNMTYTAPAYFDGVAWNGPVSWAQPGRDTVGWNPAWGAIPRVTSIRDLDALFVANLGSSWNVPNSAVPVRCWRAQTSPTADAKLLESFLPSYNLAGLRTATTTVTVMPTTNPLLPTVTVAGPPIQVDLLAPQAPLGVYTFPLMALNDPGEPRRSIDAATANLYTHDAFRDPGGAYPSYTATQRTAICELIINDMRLSLFGSSPGYRDDRGDGSYFFRALDLNGDGVAHCSGFASTGVDVALNLDRYTTLINGNGVATVAVANYFSNSGVFFIGKSRFWRISVRGEVWDSILNTTVCKSQLESVIAVDPMNESQEWVDPATPGYAPDPAKGQYATHVIYQRWLFDPNRAFLPRIQP